MDSQLKRGILNICILQLLKQEDRYGYDIIKILQGLFPDTDESTIYAILRRLNKGGLTEVYYSEKSLGPQRKYYKIVEKGKLHWIMTWMYSRSLTRSIFQVQIRTVWQQRLKMWSAWKPMMHQRSPQKRDWM